MAQQGYRFGRFSVFAATRELRDGDAPVELAARAFDCLVYLIEHRERAVGRDELIAAVWGRADVSEALLNHTILKIRRALGDSGQALVRTVPRFGYRWVGTIAVDAPRADGAHEASDASTLPASAPSASRPGSATTRIRGPHPIALALALALGILAVALIAIVLARRAPVVALPAAAVDADADAKRLALPALVLPAEIEAGDDWAWLRFGIMDLVANRLRSGAIRTVPSESVVALLKQHTAKSGDALLRDPSLASMAALRILPRVRFAKDVWTVQLDATGTQQRVLVDAEASDPIAAAREAATRLLAKLGHASAANDDAPISPALDDLLQRTGAAMLADQLDQARALIEENAPDLRNAPQIQQRMAQIELRAGDYAAVEQRLLALIDRLDPKRDAALRARALITLASSYVRRNQFDKADEAYAEAIALRSTARDPEVLGMAYLGRGIGLAQKARYDEASDALGRARIELETAGDALGVAQVDVNLGDFQVMRNRPADALPMLQNAARRFEELGAREGSVYTLTDVAAVQRKLLDPVAALATTERFWPPESHTSNPRMQWRATRERIEALLANGRLRDAQALVDRVRTDSDPTRDAGLRAQVEALAARIASARGDAKEAARLAGAATTQTLMDGDNALYARNLLLHASALRDGGDIAAAAEPTRRLRELADTVDDDALRVDATLGQASQAWAEGRREEALSAFADALQRAVALNVPDTLVEVGAPYIGALIEASHLDDARSVSGRIAPWAERDLRAANAQVALFRALDRPDAERNAQAVAARLAGEGALPKDIGMPAHNEPPTR